MFYLNVWLTVQDADRVPGVADALRRTGEKSRGESGCRRWEAYQSEVDPKRFLLVEQWEQRADWEAHRRGEAVTQIYLKEVIPFVEREAHHCTRVL